MVRATRCAIANGEGACVCHGVSLPCATSPPTESGLQIFPRIYSPGLVTDVADDQLEFDSWCSPPNESTIAGPSSHRNYGPYRMLYYGRMEAFPFAEFPRNLLRIKAAEHRPTPMERSDTQRCCSKQRTLRLPTTYCSDCAGPQNIIVIHFP